MEKYCDALISLTLTAFQNRGKQVWNFWTKSGQVVAFYVTATKTCHKCRNLHFLSKTHFSTKPCGKCLLWQVFLQCDNFLSFDFEKRRFSTRATMLKKANKINTLRIFEIQNPRDFQHIINFVEKLLKNEKDFHKFIIYSSLGDIKTSKWKFTLYVVCTNQSVILPRFWKSGSPAAWAKKRHFLFAKLFLLCLFLQKKKRVKV